MTDIRALRDIITDQAEAKGLTSIEIAKKIGAPESYVEALFVGDKKFLPALPYLRQHLIRMSDLLGLPSDMLVNKFKEECAAMQSGSLDKLPGNRFALPSYRKQYTIGIAVMVGIIVIGVIARSGFFGQPSLIVTQPESSDGPFITSSSTVILTGRISPGDTLLVNGEHVSAQGDGSFSSEFQLTPELNTIDFVAQRFLGRQTTIRRQIYFEPKESGATTTVRIVVPITEEKPASSSESAAQ
jgi:hypothetical protein